MDMDLKNKTLNELEELVAEFGGKKYLAKYIFSFIHAKDAAEIEDVTPLSKDLRQKLIEAGYYISAMRLVEKFVDPDGTIKFLFELGDGVRIETVLMVTAAPQSRKTLCISCQGGCRMGCAFCATGKLKYQRNLTAAEIVDQVNYVAADCGAVNNVVYMGMGEPMDNYDNVMRSIQMINHHAGKNIGQRHITISTCGVTEGIDRFADEKLQVHLAISLHSPCDQVRSKIMSIAGKYPLGELFDSIKHYQKRTKRRVMFEYCMIKGLNDTDSDAKALAKLLKGLNANVNLIEYNQHDGCEFEPSSRNRIQSFLDILMTSGVETTVRYKRGQTIKAACGQLGATWIDKCD
ncbi:MAG TPA: 23S rRNA (adenine(2503)-C(2))-methyltransferase RlmN [Phycisphaerales bacterium]|nr:23S rRNA (adenine(2503)-C(2))-methyltransferase RlmN [Phycisphaerales bacterium]